MYDSTTAQPHESTKARQHNSTTARVAVVLLLAVQLACGYKVASNNRMAPDIGTLAIVPLENQTTTFEVEQILTRSLVRAFIEKSSYNVVSDPSQADAVFQGVISQVSANPVTFGEATFGSTFLVTLIGRVELRDRETAKLHRACRIARSRNRKAPF